MESSLLMSIFLGIGLAAATGFRIFLPLFALSLAAHFDWWILNEQWAWLGSTAAVLTFGFAMLAEILAYYIPWVDNLLDTIAVPLAGIAGTAIMVATMGDVSPLITWSLAIIAGGGTAAAVKGATASSRLTSSVTTAGLGNPVVSTVETGGAVTMSILSFIAPVIAGIAAIFILGSLFWIYRKLRPRQKQL
ncbi:DUF4126 domain-containing protein [Robertkochia marina]|uniref:DUF4126 domain-containing protein n=1 Tax=Robertkochia marina TaxID=1227945 RepID=A0A4S3LZS1_9FLAO|nr:DUF4126 domain-containing protein [Robertkochia marina]THD66681.1 DUF4126 domain-containing protein [Robertkochia marina]TRZ45481.1 DUF4126 domain-containing protein [Robertkochia marina]